MLRHLVNLFLSPLPPTRLFSLRRLFLAIGRVDLGKNASVCGRGWIYGRGQLRIGAESWISPGVVFYTHLDAPIVIGGRCDIGPAVEFVTGGHDVGPPDRRAGRGTAKPIVVNDGCWIGARCLILGGVTIGSGAVVAAGSVVTEDVPENVLAAGVPAIVKKKFAQ
jgi:maltose O-acetyltransferase